MIRTILALLLGSSMAFGQTTSSHPAFDIADVHASPTTAFGGLFGPIIRGTRYEVRGASIVDLISIAYDTLGEQVVGGPPWLGTRHFDVIAKVPLATSKAAAKLMLQDLLADRFKLTIHHDNKPVSVFVLTQGKGKHKLKDSDGRSTGCQGQPQGPPQPGVIPQQVVSCHNLKAADIAETLGQMASGYLDHPVIDGTKLEGAWDFDIQWTAKFQLLAAGADGISIFDAVEKQLGLKLETQKMPMDVIMVDSVADKPTENAADVGRYIPEAPKEFEVADIKPADPNSTGTNIRFNAGRVDAEASFKDLITIALDISPNFVTDVLVGAPKFLDSERFRLVAKVPTPAGPEALPPVNELQAMLRALIIDRFNLVTHTENRETTVYALSAPKGEGKLKKADPSNRQNCRNDITVAQTLGTSNGWICQSMSMKELAEFIQTRASAYMVHPVVDVTGLPGLWDFTLGWTAKAQLQVRPADAAAGTAADPQGFTIFEAVEKQLGLKLDAQKRAYPVTVIDHIDQKPKQ